MSRAHATEAERERFLALARRFQECSEPAEPEHLRIELVSSSSGSSDRQRNSVSGASGVYGRGEHDLLVGDHIGSVG